MNRHGLSPRFLVFGLFMALATPCHASLDEVQVRLLRQIETPLRWDNIESAPAWVSGVTPVYRNDLGLHGVRLAPGESVTLRIERDERLRVWRPDGELDGNDLEMEFSLGSGLYQYLPSAVSEDRHGLLSRFRAGAAYLVRLSRPLLADTPIDVVLFASRREPFGELAPYRREIELSGEVVQVRRGDQAASQPFRRIIPGRSVEVPVHGPARFAFENRLEYPPDESAFAQSYRVHAWLGDAPLVTLEFETSPETAWPIYVNGDERVLGRAEVGYLEIPPGDHVLRLDSTALMAARLLRQEQPDYLFPGLNDLDRDIPPVTGPEVALSDDSPVSGSVKDESEVVAQEGIALRLTRDNARREGGLLGAMIMRRTAARHQGYPAIRAVAEELFGHHSFYRDLLPQEKLTPEPMRFAYFMPREIHALGEQGKVRAVVGEQHLQELLDRIPGAYFFVVPSKAGGQSPGIHRYPLPERAGPSVLRVIVDASHLSGGEFFLRLDDSAPIRMRIASPEELPLGEYGVTVGDMAMEMLSRRSGGSPTDTMTGVYGAGLTPARMIRAGVMEIPMPRSVREVRVWQEAGASAGIRLALQYRSAKPFALTEAAYLEEAGRVENVEMREVLARALSLSVEKESERPAQELRNHWLPVIRALRSDYRSFVGSVSPEPEAFSVLHQRDMSGLDRSRSAARAAEEQGQWLVALEIWGELARYSSGPQRDEVRLAQARALFPLGEAQLAEYLLRGLAVHSGESSIRREACDLLVSHFAENGDTESLRSLWAAMTVLQPNAFHMRRLAESAIDGGEFAMGLAIGLLLPEEDQPREHLLRASHRLGWWAVYQRFLLAEPVIERQAFWRALAIMSRRGGNEALESFLAGGEQGLAWLSVIEKGSILFPDRDMLEQNAELTDKEMESLRSFEAANPGFWHWREEMDLIRDGAGGETLYSIDRDSYGKVLRISAEKPGRLRVVGPVRLRFEVRPLHDVSASQPVDGWLHVRDGNGLRLLPIIHNVPATGLEVVGRDDIKPGRKVVGEFYFGAGPHDIELDAGSTQVLLRVLARCPEIPVPLAPLPDRGAWTSRPVVPDVYTFTRNVKNVAQPLDGYPDVTESLSLRLVWPEADRLRSGDIEGALLMHPGDDAVDAERRMTLLLWWAEHNPAVLSRALADAEALGARYPGITSLQAMLARMGRDALWQAVPGILDSAGQRFVDVNGWRPENPRLRARKALMSQVGDDEQVATGNGRLVFSLRNLIPTQVTLYLRREELAHLAPQPMVAWYQLDDNAPVSVALPGGDHPQGISVSVPAGDHVLRVGIENPRFDQFLLARLLEHGRSIPFEPIERSYHVATLREPLHLAVAGPAWLRIDESRDGSVESSYRYIAGDYDELLLVPEGGRTEALFRVFQRGDGPARGTVLPRATAVAADPVPWPTMRLDAAEPSRTVFFRDGFPLGGQEDGTWNFTAELVRRRDTESAEIGSVQQYSQFGVTHSYYDVDWRTYYRTSMLYRLREAGDPTLGMSEFVDYRPAWSTARFSLAAEGYLQHRESLVSKDGDGWLFSVKGGVSQKRDISPRTYHLPHLFILGRILGMDGISRASSASGDVDLDVFTSYKAEHRHGLEVGDTLYHRPWLDSIWFFGAKVTSNEDFNPISPDHCSVQAGWRQLLGAFQVDVAYQLNHYWADDQRAASANQQAWLLNASWSQWDGWRDNHEIGMKLRHDSDTQEITGMVYFSWRFSNGRRYLDLLSGEVDFQDQRSRAIPAAPNNVVVENGND